MSEIRVGYTKALKNVRWPFDPPPKPLVVDTEKVTLAPPIPSAHRLPPEATAFADHCKKVLDE